MSSAQHLSINQLLYTLNQVKTYTAIGIPLGIGLVSSICLIWQQPNTWDH